jgi:hypothetical protein
MSATSSLASILSLVVVTSLGLAACAAADDAPAPDDGTAPAIQDEELKKSITSCQVDGDCVAVPRGGCCSNGWKDAVNAKQTKAYESATKCKTVPRPFCPMYVVRDMRVAQCDGATRQCKMFAADDIACGGFTAHPHQCPTGTTCSHLGVNPDAAGNCVVDALLPLQGAWGADQATLAITKSGGSVGEGCGDATLENIEMTDATHFTANGSHTAGTGVRPPQGQGPVATPATFVGRLSGSTLTLTMHEGAATTKWTFTKNRHVDLVHCL